MTTAPIAPTASTARAPHLRDVFAAPRGRRFAPSGARTARIPGAASAPGTQSRQSTATRAPRRNPYPPSTPHPTASCTPTYTLTTPRTGAMLDQMRGNPRVAYRIRHGDLPAWMRAPAPRDGDESAAPVRRPPRHRRAGRLSSWLQVAVGYGLAALTGALASYTGYTAIGLL